MRLGIIGYGRMGNIVEAVAKQRNHQIVTTIDDGADNEIKQDVDCYIDFSISEAIYKNLPRICESKVPVVIGTTGWLSKKEEFSELFQKHQNTGIWGGNFSLGVNLYWKVVREAASVFDKFAKDYDVMIHEFHHRNKIDSPSGTALQTAEIIIEQSSVKEQIVTEALQRRRKANEIHVTSTRGGSVPGTHNLIYDSLFDSIEIKHTARTREGFALGAVLAAEKIGMLNPGLYNFTEIFDEIFS